MRNAKIVCTLGPASNDRDTVRKLADAGMSVARLNASHGSLESRATTIDRVRSVDEACEQPIGIMLDLKGPEVRTGTVSGEEPIRFETGSEVVFVEGPDVTETKIGLSHVIDAVKPGDRILLDDGLVETTVLESDPETDSVRARIEAGGELGSRAGVNVPGVDLGLDAVTENDRANLELAADREVDFVAASFVRDADDVYAVNEILEELDADVSIISKIERAGAVENVSEIIDASYGVMVARGDLGVECPMEDVPMIQKRIIRECHNAGRPVITATEMLDSMVTARRPTRAEASDVANAVLDGTDAVMLSAETAVGEYPIEVVETMTSIIREVENSEEYRELLEQRVPAPGESRTDALARSARYLARDLEADVVIAATESGYTALKAAKYRPSVPVVASTPRHEVRRRLALSWGIVPLYADVSDHSGEGDHSADAVIERAVQAALDAGVADSGDTVVVLCGMMTDLEGANTTNTLKVHVAADAIATGRAVVNGRASGPLARPDDGDLSTVPAGSILVLDDESAAEFTGPLDRIAGIVDRRRELTGYPAVIAREIEVPMIGGADLTDLESGTTVTIDAERGVVYRGTVAGRSDD